MERWIKCAVFDGKLIISETVRDTANVTINLLLVWHCKLSSGRGLRKRRSAPPYGLCFWKKNFTFLVTII